jgi:hypothetical protein
VGNKLINIKPSFIKSLEGKGVKMGNPESQPGGETSGEQEKQHLATLVMINSALDLREELKTVAESLPSNCMTEIIGCQKTIADIDQGLSFWFEKLQYEGFFCTNRFIIAFDSSKDEKITVGEYHQAEICHLTYCDPEQNIEKDVLVIKLPDGYRLQVFFDDLRKIELIN